MKHTKRKLVLIMLISMAVAFVVIAVSFHLIINAHVRNRAENSILQYMDPEMEGEEIMETDDAMVVVSFTYDQEQMGGYNGEEDEDAFNNDMMDDSDYDEDWFCFEDEGFEDDSDFCAPDTPAEEHEKAVDCEVREKLNIDSLGKEKTVLFLNISDTDHSIDSLVNLFYTQALQTLVSEADKKENGQLDVPCRIVFDDFASGTVIPDFDKVISVIRSRDIWVTISIQSLSQLESLYSNAQSLTIQNNCDHIVYLGSNDIGSAEFIGTRAGKVPEEILAMDRTKEYLIEGGKKGMLVDKVPPYSYSEGLQAE